LNLALERLQCNFITQFGVAHTFYVVVVCVHIKFQQADNFQIMASKYYEYNHSILGLLGWWNEHVDVALRGECLVIALLYSLNIMTKGTFVIRTYADTDRRYVMKKMMN